jgi:hypothetical protein
MDADPAFQVSSQIESEQKKSSALAQRQFERKDGGEVNKMLLP